MLEYCGADSPRAVRDMAEVVTTPNMRDILLEFACDYGVNGIAGEILLTYPSGEEELNKIKANYLDYFFRRYMYKVGSLLKTDSELSRELYENRMNVMGWVKVLNKHLGPAIVVYDSSEDYDEPFKRILQSMVVNSGARYTYLDETR
jgi:hypothetical protein